jgi:Dolichyl-phosphate-mannose-protein mannosyltransferase
MKGFLSKHKQDTVLMMLIVLGSCLRVFVCLQHNPMDYLFSDPLRHWMNGLKFPRGGYTAASDPILYQVYMYAVERITWLNKFEVGLFSAALSVLMPVPYYLAARNFGLRKTPSLWAWVLIAWTPSLFTIYHYIMMETLLLAMDGLALWTTARYLKRGGTLAFLLSVVCWTLACLTKPTVIPLAGVCVLWSLWKRLPSFPAMATGVVLVVLLLLPQAIRSKVRLGFIAPFGNPWLTKIQHRSGARGIEVYIHSPGDPHLNVSDSDYKLIFISPSCAMEPLWPFSHWMIRRADGNSMFTMTIDSARGARDWKNTYDSLHVGWREWMAQWGENIVTFLFAPSWPDTTASQTHWDDWLTYVTRWMWAPLIIFLLIYNAREFLRRRFELIPVAVTLFTLFLLLQNVATSEGRYRKPLEPLLLLNFVWLVGGRAASLGGHKAEEVVASPEAASSVAPELTEPASRFAQLRELPSIWRSRNTCLSARHGREVDCGILLPARADRTSG